jgi:hypothetical protein
MTEAGRRMRLSALGAVLVVGGCASAPRHIAGAVVSRWSAESAAAGRRLLDEYGTPDDATWNRLTWDHRGGWKRTIVWNSSGFWGRARIDSESGELAVIEQTVDYPLTFEQSVALQRFSGDLVVDAARGELSSRAGSEELDRLTLNLADEIARGAATVRQARETYVRVVETTAAGKSSPYTAGLLFAAGDEKRGR